MPNKIYQQEETVITWTDSTGTLAMTLQNLAANSGRIGARRDWGAAPRSFLFAWRAIVAGFATAPAVGDSVNIYLARSDGTLPDANVGTADAALGSVEDLAQMFYLGSIRIRSTSTTDDHVTGGRVILPERYCSPVWYVSSADNLENTANVHKFLMWPIPPEIQ